MTSINCIYIEKGATKFQPWGIKQPFMIITIHSICKSICKFFHWQESFFSGEIWLWLRSTVIDVPFMGGSLCSSSGQGSMSSNPRFPPVPCEDLGSGKGEKEKLGILHHLEFISFSFHHSFFIYKILNQICSISLLCELLWLRTVEMKNNPGKWKETQPLMQAILPILFKGFRVFAVSQNSWFGFFLKILLPFCGKNNISWFIHILILLSFK